MELFDSPVCRRCVPEEKISLHVSCECESLTALTHTCVCSFSLDPEDVRSQNLGEFDNFIKETEILRLGHQSKTVIPNLEYEPGQLGVSEKIE
jgi:hypothetical protein